MTAKNNSLERLIEVARDCRPQLPDPGKNATAGKKALNLLREQLVQIDEIHARVHTIRNMCLFWWNLQATHLEQEYGIKQNLNWFRLEPPPLDLRQLKKELPKVIGDERPKRSRLAVCVAEALIKFDENTHDELEIVMTDDWCTMLIMLANLKGNQSVANPQPTPGQYEQEISDLGGHLLQDELCLSIWTQLNNLIDDRDGLTKRKIKNLTPSLTWGEVLYYYYEFLQSVSRDKSEPDYKNALERRKQLDCQFYPLGENYCFDCDEPFVVTKYHPCQSLCTRCTTKVRVANYRRGQSKGRKH
jgi:hypothetical protein